MCSRISLATHKQFLWALYQEKVKRAMHAQSYRTVSAPLAATATNGDLASQHALLAASPSLTGQLTAPESFTGAVPKTLKGSKRYWRAAFVQLMAMCIEYGAPEFFLTLTANEMGWVDLRRACDGRTHSEAPVEATRHYDHRWQEFKSASLRVRHRSVRSLTSGIGMRSRGAARFTSMLRSGSGKAQRDRRRSAPPPPAVPTFDPYAEEGLMSGTLQRE